MKKSIWLMLLLLQGAWSQTLRVEEAIAKTLAHHPDVKRFMLRLQQAQKGYDAAYADYLPQLNLSASYSPTQTYVLPVNGTFHTIDDTGWNAGVVLRQKVWDFSHTSSLVKAAKIDEDISALSLDETKALLAYKVKTLYALMVVQREAVDVRRKDLAAKRAFYAQAQALVKQGLKTHADAHRFLSAVYAAEDNLAGAKAALDKARMSLSLYMGEPIPSGVKLQKSTLKRTLHIPKGMEREVLRHNRKIRMDRLAVEKSLRLHKATEALHYGTVDLSASHNRFGTLNTYNTDVVTLSYNIPLFTGGRLTAQEQQAKIGYYIAEEQVRSEEIALKEELRGLLIDLDRYRKTVKAKQAQLTSAKSSLALLKARYKEGLATYIEVLDSTALVLNARLALLEAYYAQTLAYDRIEYLKGAQ